MQCPNYAPYGTVCCIFNTLYNTANQWGPLKGMNCFIYYLSQINGAGRGDYSHPHAYVYRRHKIDFHFCCKRGDISFADTILGCYP